MVRSRALRSPVLVGIAMVLGLAACKPSAPTPGDTTPPPDRESATEGVAAAVDAINPITSPREAVIASINKMMEARSYHASMEIDGGPQGQLRNEVDFVAPGRMRMQMAGMGTQRVIGDTMYMTLDGRSMQVPMPKGTMTRWRDPGNFRAAEAGLTAEGLGSETVNGVTARKYALHHTMPDAAAGTLWISADDLPLKMQVTSGAPGKQVTTTIRYSRFNDPSIRIDAPK